MARLCPLFSGSKGNSYYIGSKKAGILVDAGRSAKQIEMMLKACDIEISAIQGICVTHEHTDHISGVRVFAKKHAVPVFASKGTMRAMAGAMMGEVAVSEMEDELQIADMTISPFHTSHDCAEPLGYRIKTKDERVITVATDLGFLSEEVKEALSGVDFAVIESNHDVEMLRHGPYPYYLQKRILSERGHLSNETCADFLPYMAKNGTTRFLLAHLSQENNSRSLALETAMARLLNAGFISGEDFILDAARVENVSGNTILF